MSFEQELEHLINHHSMENGSNTPDFILAQYLRSCLLVFNAAVQQRETWYNRGPAWGSVAEVDDWHDRFLTGQ